MVLTRERIEEAKRKVRDTTLAKRQTQPPKPPKKPKTTQKSSKAKTTTSEEAVPVKVRPV